MQKDSKKPWLLIGAALLLVLALGVSVVFAQTGDGDTPPDDEGTTDEGTTTVPFGGWFGHHGSGMHDFGGFKFGGRFSELPEGLTPRDELLADALDITVEELQAAREEAHAAWLAEMVDAGYMTQEQVDMMLAYQAFMGSFDRESLVAEALGISVEELQGAKSEGKTLATLLEEQDLTPEDFSTGLQAAYQKALDDAVQNGVLTQEQADQIAAGGFGHHGFGGFEMFGEFGGGMRGHGGRGHHGGPGMFGESGMFDESGMFGRGMRGFGFGSQNSSAETTGANL